MKNLVFDGDFKKNLKKSTYFTKKFEKCAFYDRMKTAKF